MRKIFISTLIDIAQDDERVLLLTGDLGYSILEPFKDKFPDRFFNVGVAEQNMIGLATGLAEAGYIPFVYSISNFAVLRPYEFIRNGPILHQFPVRIVGTGGGFNYGTAGPTHHALEDVGIMRLQKGIVSIIPADCNQARNALLATWNLPKPVYYRLDKNDQLEVSELCGRFDLGKADMICKGTEIALVCMGGITSEVMSAVAILRQNGISPSVIVVSSFNPSPEDDLTHLLKSYHIVITVEDHYITGGLGSFISELVSEKALQCCVVRCGIQGTPRSATGSESYYRDAEGLSCVKLVERVVQEMGREKGI